MDSTQLQVWMSDWIHSQLSKLGQQSIGDAVRVAADAQAVASAISDWVQGAYYAAHQDESLIVPSATPEAKLTLPLYASIEYAVRRVAFDLLQSTQDVRCALAAPVNGDTRCTDDCLE